MSRRPTWLRWLRYLTYNLVVLVAVDYAFYRRWVGKLAGLAVPMDRQKLSQRVGLPVELIHSLGDFRDTVERRDLRTLPVHRPDKIRILALGDSFTYGEEVIPGLDYPALLQARFVRAGFDNVEVINLGSSWWGFGQAFRLWDQLARRYGASFILLGPGCFQPIRDEAFNHTDGHGPYYLHGRYVLDGDDVKWVDVIGDANAADAFRNYYRFIPHWDYLRYDRNPPAFLQSLLPQGKTLGNPFYYSSLDPEEESRRIYQRLLKKPVGGPSQVVLLHKQQRVIDLGRRFASQMVSSRLPWLGFPNVRALGHHSGPGNAFIAECFFEILTGQEEIAAPLLHFTDVTPSTVLAPGVRPLAELSHAEVRIGNARLAVLAHARTQWGLPGMGDDLVDFHKLGTRSLFALKPTDLSLLDCPVLLLDTPLKPGMKVELETITGGARSRLPIGEVLFPSPDLSFGYVTFDAIEPLLEWEGKLVLHPRMLPAPMQHPQSGRILLDGKPIFELAQSFGQTVLLSLPRDAVAYFKPQPEDALDPSQAPDHGDMQLVLTGDPPLQRALAHFTREATHIPYDRTGLKKILRAVKGLPRTAELRAQ